MKKEYTVNTRVKAALVYKQHPQLSGMILEKNFRKSTHKKRLVVFAATLISQLTPKIPLKSISLFPLTDNSCLHC